MNWVVLLPESVTFSPAVAVSTSVLATVVVAPGMLKLVEAASALPADTSKGLVESKVPVVTPMMRQTQ